MIQILIFLNKSLFKVLSFTQIYPIAWSRDQKFIIGRLFEVNKVTEEKNDCVQKK